MPARVFFSSYSDVWKSILRMKTSMLAALMEGGRRNRTGAVRILVQGQCYQIGTLRPRVSFPQMCGIMELPKGDPEAI